MLSLIFSPLGLPTSARELGMEGDPGSGEQGKIAGYMPGTDVTSHASIDLDQAAIETALGKSPPDYAAAKKIYDGPGVSLKPSRTIKGFSTNAGTKLKDEAEYKKFVAYYGKDDYANIWVTAALDGTPTTGLTNGMADFKAVNDKDTRVQAIKKGTVYLNIWMYAIHELEAAIAKCDKAPTDTTSSVHAWDEGVAFYAGSLQGYDGKGSGKLMYAVANKRCANFNTCGASGGTDSGNSQANIKIFAAFDAGKATLEKGTAAGCTETRTHADTIIAQGFVPLIQGTIKYAWEGAQTGGSLKAKAEGATFAAGILGRLHACSPAAAKVVYDNIKIGVTTIDFKAVKSALEGQYKCLKITCEDIGGYGKGTTYKADATPCTGTPAASEPCFPSSAKVTKANGEVTTVDNLKEGDSIVAATADGKLTTDTVSVLSLAKPAASAQFVTLTTESTTLKLTEGHHVPFGDACCSMLKKAKDVQVGDKIWTVADGAKTAAVQTVTAKAFAALKGLHSPVLTNGGFPVVDGVVTSFDDAQTVSLASYTLKYLLPLCKATGSCDLFRRTFLNADRQYIDEA